MTYLLQEISLMVKHNIMDLKKLNKHKLYTKENRRGSEYRENTKPL